MPIPKSITFAINLKHKFSFGSQDEKEVLAQGVRLYVLYEDLKIEYSGAETESIPILDGTSLETRRFYFVRRTFGTLLEMSGALQALEGKKGFPPFKARMDAKGTKQWDESLLFFRNNHKFLKDCRNDVGGHFQDDAAMHALENVEDTVELYEIYQRGGGADVKLKFAYNFVAGALIKNKTKAESVEDFLKTRYFPLVIDGCRHAIRAVQVFAVAHLRH